MQTRFLHIKENSQVENKKKMKLDTNMEIIFSISVLTCFLPQIADW